MKVAIVGGGNMGAAIAHGLATGGTIVPENIVVINRSRSINYGFGIRSVVADYSSLEVADAVILAIKPWLIEEFIQNHKDELRRQNQMLVSVAAGVSLSDLSSFVNSSKPIFRLMPNTAISQKESMTFISSENATEEEEQLIVRMFSELGKVEVIDEKLFSAATAISGCGIAYALRYVRAAVQGGVEMGLTVKQAQNAVMQSMKGAIALLEANQSSPEDEIDKVTTPGGLTIRGLNAMEEAGFSSAVIKGLKASNLK